MRSGGVPREEEEGNGRNPDNWGNEGGEIPEGGGNGDMTISLLIALKKNESSCFTDKQRGFDALYRQGCCCCLIDNLRH